MVAESGNQNQDQSNQNQDQSNRPKNAIVDVDNYVSGSCGAGKSHLAQAIGLAAIQQGYRVMYREKTVSSSFRTASSSSIASIRSVPVCRWATIGTCGAGLACEAGRHLTWAVIVQNLGTSTLYDGLPSDLSTSTGSSTPDCSTDSVYRPAESDVRSPKSKTAVAPCSFFALNSTCDRGARPFQTTINLPF